jgi:hypothetical protein
MTTQQAIDQAKIQAFMGKVMTDSAGADAIVMASVGDRLGLLKALARGSATSAELAEHAHVQERYAREWLSEMACAGYLEYDPVSQRFTLPPEQALVLAQEGGPFFLAGAFQMVMAQLGAYNQLLYAFQHGGGVPMEAYDPSIWDGMERMSSGVYEHVLVPMYLPALPEVQAKLERGEDVADIDCGHGKALIKLAQTYPRSRYVGYDTFAPSIARATAKAQEAGVTDRVRSDGRYVCVDYNASDKLEANAGPIGSLFYGASVLYCMTTSLAGHGEGLGTLGLPEAKMRELAQDAGFGEVKRFPTEVPFKALYEMTL